MMVSSRVALGSVSTLAVAALVLGAAPLVLRSWAPSNPTPFGAISSFSGSLSSSTPSDGDRSQLLKLAALKSGKADAASDPAITAAAQLAPAAPAVPVPAPPVETAAAGASPTAPDVAPGGATTVEQAPVAMASADASDSQPVADPVPLPPTAPLRTTSALININRASSDTLDHFPGAGHIGRAIVSHRPYRAIEDLVKRRVLRERDFARIQGHISVD